MTFKTAEDYDVEKEKEDQIKRSIAERPSKEAILTLKGRIGSFTVMCPNCSCNQECRTTLSKKCVRCDTTFTIFPSGSPSRVVKCHPKKIHLLHQLYYLEKEGKYMEIF